MEEYEKKRDTNRINCLFLLLTIFYILGWIKLLKIIL